MNRMVLNKILIISWKMKQRLVLEISFLHTVTGHGNEIFYDAYVRYTPKSTKSKESNY